MRTCVLLLALRAAAQDPLEIVRKSVDHDQYNWRKAKDYTYIIRSTFQEKDSKGSIKKIERDTSEMLILYGEPFQRLIEKDGKPLSPSGARKEQQRFDRETARRARESEAERKKRLDAFERKRKEQREFAREIPDAFLFSLLGEETVNGRRTWVIDAQPRPDYKPKLSRAAMLKKFKGRLWIDQQEYQWARLEAEAVDTVSWGLFLARLAKGSRIHLEQVRVNDEVWLPKTIKAGLDARLALLKRMQAAIDVQFSDFRKFQTDSKIVPASEVSERSP